MMMMMVMMVMTDDGDHGDDDDHGDHCQFVLCSILAGLKYYSDNGEGFDDVYDGDLEN